MHDRKMANKRQQFSSCEACRRSKLGCDARRTPRGKPCSNCARQGKQCIVKWEKYTVREPGKGDSQNSSSSLVGLSPVTRTTNQKQEGTALHDVLLKVFASVFESRYSSLLKSHALSSSLPTEAVGGESIISLMISLDQEEFRNDMGSPRTSSSNSALCAAIRAFALKFLVARNNPTQGYPALQQQSCFTSIWRDAVRLSKQSMKTRSYESALSLYIIGIASSSAEPLNKPPNFELQCFERASRHINDLQITKTNRHGTHHSPKTDVAFWCSALTENSWQLNQPDRTIAKSLFSQKSHIWPAVRDQTYLFHQSFSVLHAVAEPLAKEVVAAVLQHATLHKCMTWYNLNRVRNCDEGDWLGLVNVSIQDIVTFQEVFTPLLDLIGRDFLFLNPKDQLSYVLVTVHFHWAVLLLMGETNKRSVNIPARNYLSELVACRTIVNVFTRAQPIHGMIIGESEILLMDPMPEMMVDCIDTTTATLLRLFDTGNISLGACGVMVSVVLANLKTLHVVSLKAKRVSERLGGEAMQRSILKAGMGGSWM